MSLATVAASTDAGTDERRTITLAAVHASTRLNVQAVHEKCNNVLAQLEQTGVAAAPKHAALFFENITKKDGTAQQQQGNCIACDLHVVSTGAYKFQSHVLACTLMPTTVKKVFKNMRESTESKRAAKRERKALEETELQLAAQQQEMHNKMLKQQYIRTSIKECQVVAADKAIA